MEADGDFTRAGTEVRKAWDGDRSLLDLNLESYSSTGAKLLVIYAGFLVTSKFLCSSLGGLKEQMNISIPS